MSPDYRRATFDTDPGQHVSVTVDIGLIPDGYPDAGDFVITIQVLPLPDRRAAEQVCTKLREVIESGLGVKFLRGEGHG